MSMSADDDNRSNYESMSIKNLRIMLVTRGYDCSQCLEKSDLVTAALSLDNTDYDDEGEKLFRELNLKPAAVQSKYSNLDPIWKQPEGGTVYVGNYVAASDRRTLRERNIVAIVNCQDATSKNYFEDDSTMHYYRFVVARLAVTIGVEPLEGGFQEAFDFIQAHVDRGNSVLIHCLAGAHRAGTVGTAWLMLKTGKGRDDALIVAKKCRKVINPFGILLGLLYRLERELAKSTTAPGDGESQKA